MSEFRAQRRKVIVLCGVMCSVGLLLAAIGIRHRWIVLVGMCVQAVLMVCVLQQFLVWELQESVERGWLAGVCGLTREKQW